MDYKRIHHLCISLVFVAKISISMEQSHMLADFFSSTSVTNLDFTQACAKFDDIKYRLKLYKDTCEDTYDALESVDYLKTSNSSVIGLGNPVTEYLHNAQSYIDSIDFLSNHYKNTKGNKLLYASPFSVILGGFVEKRMEFLNNRRINKFEMTKPRNKHVTYLQSTYPEYIESLSEENSSSSYEKLSYYLIQDFYETMNFCIIELFKWVSDDFWKDTSPELVKTKKLLQYSISLWPDLMQDPPDQRVSMGHPDQAIEETQELDLYRKFILRESDLTISIKRESLDCPLFKEKKTSVSSSAIVGVWESPESCVVSSLSAVKKKKKKKKKASSATVMPSENLCSSDIERTEESTEVASEDDVETEKVPAPGANVEAFENKDVNETTDTFEDYQFRPYAKQSAFSVEKEPSYTSFLKGHHKTTFDQIMETPFSGTLYYRDFVNLWERLGGTVQTTSGSHRKLMWNKQCMGGTYEPHGGHNYGFRTVKYLRDSLNQLLERGGFRI
ncbi:MAG: hypothetical protein C0432_01300 [Candidatus Puniceispirillum sp.]|nr:hypothetical protein [Candidatus Pelagibacter sp.]MBA4282917.1 hypothetical protein [Candidatus Puniceispirillum sp.]